MDYFYLLRRVNALQLELAQMAVEHNRKYLAKKRHSPMDKAKHQELRERLFQIRAELQALVERKSA
jgi:hypothetical protein